MRALSDDDRCTILMFNVCTIVLEGDGLKFVDFDMMGS